MSALFHGSMRKASAILFAAALILFFGSAIVYFVQTYSAIGGSVSGGLYGEYQDNFGVSHAINVVLTALNNSGYVFFFAAVLHRADYWLDKQGNAE